MNFLVDEFEDWLNTAPMEFGHTREVTLKIVSVQPLEPILFDEDEDDVDNG